MSPEYVEKEYLVKVKMRIPSDATHYDGKIGNYAFFKEDATGFYWYDDTWTRDWVPYDKKLHPNRKPISDFVEVK